MALRNLHPILASELRLPEHSRSLNWLWDGYLMPGDLTLLVSLWKTGKTTLLTGLLRQLATGQPFLGRNVRKGHALIVSEESESHWADRQRLQPLGDNVRILPRPYSGMPTEEDWNAIIDEAVAMRERGQLDLFVVDPIASLLPIRSESDASSMIQALQPVRRLANSGVSVLLMHHPRKEETISGSNARGSGALLGFVDSSLELSKYSRMSTDVNRRLILAQSRRNETPERLAYEYDPQRGMFATVGDPRDIQFNENWCLVEKLLTDNPSGLTLKEIMNTFPEGEFQPSYATVYNWMTRGFDMERVRREGAGTRKSPYRYRLPNDDDTYYDRGELPPIHIRGNKSTGKRSHRTPREEFEHASQLLDKYENLKLND